MSGSSPFDPVQAARRLCRRGVGKQFEGDLDTATTLYERSLEAHETAEAWCYLGWCYSLRGHFGIAIAHCRRAISMEPDFGNPYNDLGAYLVECRRPDEAIQWFERAKTAPRYETPQFPYLNLARVHIRRRQYGPALLELQAARLIAPYDERVDELVDYLGTLVRALATSA